MSLAVPDSFQLGFSFSFLHLLFKILGFVFVFVYFFRHRFLLYIVQNVLELDFWGARITGVFNAQLALIYSKISQGSNKQKTHLI